jgi:hypothetical protein
MKLSITPVALAVTMALGAAVAQAQTPTYGTTAAAGNGLYLAVWDNATGFTDLVNLTSLESQISVAGGALTTPTPGSNGWTQVSNFDGYATVDQIDLGTISNFASLFPTSSQSAATQYGVYAAGSTSDIAATIAVGTGSTVTTSAVNTMDLAITGEQAEWSGASNTSPLGDKTNTQSYSVPSGNGSLQDGGLGLAGSGDSFSNAVGSAENFYNYVITTSGRNSTLTTNEEGYQGTPGFWFLSSTGDLTWNLVTTASTVPLPPAVWLFASGLIGLGLIGRRRQTGLGTAV